MDIVAATLTGHGCRRGVLKDHTLSAGTDELITVAQQSINELQLSAAATKVNVSL